MNDKSKVSSNDDLSKTSFVKFEIKEIDLISFSIKRFLLILFIFVKFSFFNNKSKINLDNLDDGKSKVLIYGAGSAGVQLASALSTSSELVPVGFASSNVLVSHVVVSLVQANMEKAWTRALNIKVI